MPTWNIGDCLHGFRVERKDILPHLNAHYWKLTHEKTGAALYYSDRDDGQMVLASVSALCRRTIPACSIS